MGKKANEIIMENHDYVLQLIDAYELEASEVYGELTVLLCELANSLDLSDPGINTKIRSQLRAACKKLASQQNDSEIEIVLCPEISAVLGNPERVVDTMFFESAFSELNDEQKFIVSQVIKGYPLSSIASDISRSVTYVKHRLVDSKNVIRRKYRNAPTTVREWYTLVGRW